MHGAVFFSVFFFHFMDRKTTMQKLFINRREKETNKNNAKGRVYPFWYLQKPKTQMFELPNTCMRMSLPCAG